MTRFAGNSTIAPLMIPSGLHKACAKIFLLLVCCFAGCKEGENRTPKSSHGVASLVPAATDLIIEMGASEKLVAVSNFDVARPGMKPLPKVGDYQYIDWEKLAEIKPAIMVIQMEPSRLPAEFAARVERLGIKLVNVKIYRLADIDSAIRVIGEAINEKDKAAGLQAKLRAQLDAVKQRVAGRPRVKTLVTRDETGVNVIGPGNFVDDLLQVAGGENVVGGETPWPSIDHERLAAIKPDVVIQLLPEAPQQLLEQADRVWKTVPELPAVKAGRVHVLSEWYALQPGGHIGKLAEKMAALLHPVAATTSPTTQPEGARPDSPSLSSWATQVSPLQDGGDADVAATR